MAILGSAVQRVVSAVRPPLSPLTRTTAWSYSSQPTKEKSVPYDKTLKQEDGTSSGPTKPLPRSADVVVIGGGSLGCQTIYHLAKMGMTNLVLLERDRLTAGTTWHTAGLLWQLRPSDVEVELLAHTRNVISKDLEEETGLHTGWIQNGGLFIASNKQRLDEYKRLMSHKGNRCRTRSATAPSLCRQREVRPPIVDDAAQSTPSPRRCQRDGGHINTVAAPAPQGGDRPLSPLPPPPFAGVLEAYVSSLAQSDAMMSELDGLMTSGAFSRSPPEEENEGFLLSLLSHPEGLGKVYGIESHVLSPAETKDLYPLMNVDDLYGTLYVPKDGTMDPAGTCTTLTRAATARGATVIENCPVTGIQVRTDDFGMKRVKAVETPHGNIETPCVVNCAGVWATKLGEMAGVKVPLIAMHHAYVVTERIEGIQNMPNVRDHDASVYLRLQGDALSVGGYEHNPIFWDEARDNGEQGSSSGGDDQIKSFTADHKPLMGEAPEVRGFYLGCGFNSAGMMLGGGCGRELAHWIIHGRPEKDMYGYDIRRFHNSLTDNTRWIRERSHESYAKNYSVVFPFDEPLASRNMRKDPFHQ
ncbi:hypothetical protein FQN60_007998, partial [Etheostoma spectabile]